MKLFIELIAVFILSLFPYRILFFKEKKQEFSSILEDEFIKDIDQLISENIADTDFQVIDIERSLGLSRPVLLQKIKQAKGTTLVNYIKYKRIEKAKLLLATTTDNISEVAYKVGYVDPKYFSKTFKKQEKKSPSQYRKSYYKNEEIQNDKDFDFYLKK
ncbi:helix-turn-helix domain-containing protein [Flammeovirga kamogawensis]|uniref:AraC family transcriptional regulator n=1 Tax=Flammeovirga kamogawensis TaxID=373891 RepID=A0ABX8H406_9BACT|nr:AraC family transcriptional regulator [Flammeovirga kamogawensis]MBB6461715.1 AraC-like DNA-binding protein [Flammeovirga kamogawensis]QWG10633.1 AraC family transcriptional regulator [Flammeovirga kamogawensis]